MNALADHDCVINDDAKNKQESKGGYHVEGDIIRRKECKCPDEGNANTGCHPERHSGTSRQHQHQKDQ